MFLLVLHNHLISDLYSDNYHNICTMNEKLKYKMLFETEKHSSNHIGKDQQNLLFLSRNSKIKASTDNCNNILNAN